MTFLNATLNNLEETILYHQQQIEETQNQLDQVKLSQAYGEEAVSSVEEAIENINPEHLELLKEYLLSLFETQSIVPQERTNSDRVESPKELEPPVKEQEDTPRSRAKLLGIPDFTPTKYEDLAPNISYSSDGRAYVGFNDYGEAEKFRDSISEPSMIDDAVIMNGFKHEVKFHCNKEYIEELVTQDVKEGKPVGLEKIDGQIIYNHNDLIAYLAFSAKGRADNYGSYLTRILDIADKYTVSNKPSFFDSKYELRLEDITLEDALHLQSFNLKKEWDAKENEEARELWRDSRKRVYPSACKPSPKLISPEEVNLGDIVYLNSINNQYKVLSKVELDGVPHIEVICVFNSERPSLVSAVSYLKECYLVPGDSIQIDPQFQEEKQEEVLTEDVQIYVPKPRTKQKNKPVEVSVFKLGAGDVVHRGIGDSQYEVIGTARKDADLYAECRLISSSTRSASIGNVYFFKDGLYLLEEEAKPEPIAV